MCVMAPRASRAISRKSRDPIFTSCSSHSHLYNLPYDVLALIFQAVTERPACALGEASKGPKPLDSLSRTNKMRELCMPILFERITLKCRWDLAAKYVQEMATKKGSAVRKHIKYDDFPCHAEYHLY